MILNKRYTKKNQREKHIRNSVNFHHISDILKLNRPAKRNYMDIIMTLFLVKLTTRLCMNGYR